VQVQASFEEGGVIQQSRHSVTILQQFLSFVSSARRAWLSAAVLPAAFAIAAGWPVCDARAQEFSLFGGASHSGDTHTYSWAFNYQEGLGEYFAASFMWLNEGHIPNHHRDGQAVQFWARLPLAERRFVLQAGLGPYRYFDTTTPEQGGTYSNLHGWGVVYSARAAYYLSNRVVLQLQFNRVHISGGPNTTGLLFGVGYQLDAPDRPGPRDWAAGSSTKVTNQEITFYIGRSIVNSTTSPVALAGALDYRIGLAKYLDLTVGYLHEGSNDIARRDGITSQLWLTRKFIDDEITLGLGLGGYYGINEHENSPSPGPGEGRFAGLVSISGAYRFTPHWAARLTWNRIVTSYDRDTDVIFAGIGYRF
jgi:hypothetical protein